MSRPLRIQFPQAVYHVINRGAAQQSTFAKETDYQAFLDTLRGSPAPGVSPLLAIDLNKAKSGLDHSDLFQTAGLAVMAHYARRSTFFIGT